MSLSRVLVVQVSKYIITVAREIPKKTTNLGKSSRAIVAGQTGEEDKVRMKSVFKSLSYEACSCWLKVSTSIDNYDSRIQNLSLINGRLIQLNLTYEWKTYTTKPNNRGLYTYIGLYLYDAFGLCTYEYKLLIFFSHLGICPTLNLLCYLFNLLIKSRAYLTRLSTCPSL